ncbi:hypothetical protein BaRGS_00026941, partial [Batillaria attramentaria]
LPASSADQNHSNIPGGANFAAGGVGSGVSGSSVPSSPALGGRPAVPRKPTVPGNKPRPPVPKKPPVTQKPPPPASNHVSTESTTPSSPVTPETAQTKDGGDSVEAQVQYTPESFPREKPSPPKVPPGKPSPTKGPPPPLPKVPPRGTPPGARNQSASRPQRPQRPAPPVPAKKPAVKLQDPADSQENHVQAPQQEKPVAAAPPRSYHQVVVSENSSFVPAVNEVNVSAGGNKPVAGEGKPVAGEDKPVAGEGKPVAGEGKPVADTKCSGKDDGERTDLPASAVSCSSDREAASVTKPVSASEDQLQTTGSETCAKLKEVPPSSVSENVKQESGLNSSGDAPVNPAGQCVAELETASPDELKDGAGLTSSNANSSGKVALRSPPPPPVRPKPRKRASLTKQSQVQDFPEQPHSEGEQRPESLSVQCEDLDRSENRQSVGESGKSDCEGASLGAQDNSPQDRLAETVQTTVPSEQNEQQLSESKISSEAAVQGESVHKKEPTSTQDTQCSEDVDSRQSEPVICHSQPSASQEKTDSPDSSPGKRTASQSNPDDDEEQSEKNEHCTETSSDTRLPITLQEVGETCEMLKEIEDLLKERLGGEGSPLASDSPSVGAQSKEEDDFSSPVRPPRPRRASKLKILGLESASVDSSSTESLTSVGLSGKKAPPKPKRKHLPGSVNRSLSDVTGMKNLIDQLTNEEDDEEKPFLPPRQQSLRVTSGPKPPPLPPRNKSMDSPRDGPGAGEGEASHVGASPGAGHGSPAPGSGTLGRSRGGRKNMPRPTRKAPPPPTHAPRKPPSATSAQAQTPSSTVSSPSQSSSGGSLEKEHGYRKIANGSSPVSEDINIVVPKTGVVGSLDSPSVVSDESMDHDYHEIPDHLVRDLSARLVKAAAEMGKEESPPPDLPPRIYKSHPSELSLVKDLDPSKNSDENISKSADQETPERKTTDKKSPENSLSEESISHSSRESLRPSSFSGTASGSLLDVAGEKRRASSSVSVHSGSSHSEAGSAGLEARKREKKVYYIAEEMVKSEQVFVDVLKLLNVDFRVFISEKTEQAGHSIVPSETLNKILDFLPQLQSFNEMLLKDLTDRIANWEKHKKIADVFVKKGPFLKLYSSYIRNFEHATALLDETCKKHQSFFQAVQKFEMSPRCASLALRHYMLKPIQRIPQYKLLLQDYLKHLTDDSPDYKDTIIALNIVSEVADHANESMRHGDNVQKLLEIQRSLIGQFEVIQPGRVLVKQGELMKLSRKEMQPRMFFLFSDVLLYTTPSTGGYRLNNILPLNGMKVVAPKLDEFKNEFSIISTQRSLTVAASTPDEREAWLTALYNAMDENSERYHTFKSMQQEPKTSLLDKDFVLGHKAPLWVPDARVTMCMLCLAEFSITWRRHHCRACGRIICGNCSENKAPLRYLLYKPARVCDDCYEKLKKEVEESVDDGDAKQEADEAASSVSTPEASGLSLSSLMARFQKIRKSGREKRKSGMLRPSVLKEVHANDEGSDMSGYLWVAKNKKWKRLWFVVKGKVLYTYKASEDMAAIESMPLLGFEITRMTTWYQGAEPDLMFELKHQNTQPLVFKGRSSSSSSEKGATDESASPSSTVVSPHVKSSTDTTTPRLIFRTDSAAATTKWLNVLREASLA